VSLSPDAQHKSIPDLLAAGAAQLQLALTAPQLMQLEQYINELAHWNKTFNLTAITQPTEMVVYHVFDALAVCAYWLQRQRQQIQNSDVAAWVDLGSGAGIPGMVLAIVAPEQQWLLVDGNGKKARFLRHVARSLAISSVQVYHARIEQLPASERPQGKLIYMARALGPAVDIVNWVAPWLQANDEVILMKSQNLNQEAQLTAASFTTPEIIELKVPFLDAYRCIMTTRYR